MEAVTTDWRTTALAAAAALTVGAAGWKYLVWPVISACWAAVLAAPQIRDLLHDFPELMEELRALVDSNVVIEVAALKVDVASLRSEVVALRALLPTIAGGDGDGDPLAPIPLVPRS